MSRSSITRGAAVTLLAVCGLTVLPVVAPGTAPVARAETCAQPRTAYRPVPWPQRRLAPERAWPLTRGAGVTVAVLDSGVDATRPALAGRVARGFDAEVGTGVADNDCLGTGTQVAGVIAARPSDTTGFAGVAPDVTVVPVR